jgi:glycosyltransferase involved in cell wall biosynthesis
MRIAIVSTLIDFAWGGSEELWAVLADEALAAGHEVAVMRCGPVQLPPALGFLVKKGATVLPRPRLPIRGRIRRGAIAAVNTVLNPLGALRAWRPEVVVVNQGGTYDVPANKVFQPLIEMLGRGDLPYVVICQMNDDNFFMQEALRSQAHSFFERSRLVAFVSEHNRSLAIRQLGRPLARAVVVGNPVGLADRSLVPWPDGSVVRLASVARLHVAAKGQDILLEALKEAKLTDPDWRLDFFGAGEDRDYLKRLAEYYGLADKVSFCGFVPDVRSIWGSHHALVFPSRYEGASLALAEAMLCGRPAIVTDVGGAREWVSEPETGFVAECPTHASIAAACERAWRAMADWPNIGRRAHDAAFNKHPELAGRALLALIAALRTPDTSPAR